MKKFYTFLFTMFLFSTSVFSASRHDYSEFKHRINYDDHDNNDDNEENVEQLRVNRVSRCHKINKFFISLLKTVKNKYYHMLGRPITRNVIPVTLQLAEIPVTYYMAKLLDYKLPFRLLMLDGFLVAIYDIARLFDRKLRDIRNAPPTIYLPRASIYMYLTLHYEAIALLKIIISGNNLERDDWAITSVVFAQLGQNNLEIGNLTKKSFVLIVLGLISLGTNKFIFYKLRQKFPHLSKTEILKKFLMIPFNVYMFSPFKWIKKYLQETSDNYFEIEDMKVDKISLNDLLEEPFIERNINFNPQHISKIILEYAYGESENEKIVKHFLKNKNRSRLETMHPSELLKIIDSYHNEAFNNDTLDVSLLKTITANY